MYDIIGISHSAGKVLYLDQSANFIFNCPAFITNYVKINKPLEFYDLPCMQG